MKEKFKPIKGWEDKFEISNKGYVRNIMTNTIRNGSVNNRGYLRLKLTRGKKDKYQVLIHKLVLDAFLPKPMNNLVSNHKDGNKLNNRLDNLEWGNLNS
jgi:hypothetical protein